MSLYVMLVGLLLASGPQSDSPVVVHFTAPWCPACQKMKPGISSLKQQGYDIRIVDVTKNEALALRYNVEELPTTVIVQQGKIQDRRFGYLSDQKLQAFVLSAQPLQKKPKVVYPVTTISRASIADGSFKKASQSRWISVNRASIKPLVHMLPKTIGSQLLRATVRIEIRDESGVSFGSGTIIHAQQGKALIATCGHLFRESKGKTPVEIDVYYPQGSKRVTGRVLVYDANKYDVALVTIPFDGGITPIPVASQVILSKDQRVISAGSNGGAKPTLERTVINSINRYEGPDNIQIHGAPAGGRSGGGLVDQDGRLIGICNAADHDDNEGFYISSRYVISMMTRLGIEDLIKTE